MFEDTEGRMSEDSERERIYRALEAHMLTMPVDVWKLISKIIYPDGYPSENRIEQK